MTSSSTPRTSSRRCRTLPARAAEQARRWRRPPRSRATARATPRLARSSSRSRRRRPHWAVARAPAEPVRTSRHLPLVTPARAGAPVPVLALGGLTLLLLVAGGVMTLWRATGRSGLTRHGFSELGLRLGAAGGALGDCPRAAPVVQRWATPRRRSTSGAAAETPSSAGSTSSTTWSKATTCSAPSSAARSPSSTAATSRPGGARSAGGPVEYTAANGGYEHMLAKHSGSGDQPRAAPAIRHAAVAGSRRRGAAGRPGVPRGADGLRRVGHAPGRAQLRRRAGHRAARARTEVGLGRGAAVSAVGERFRGSGRRSTASTEEGMRSDIGRPAGCSC